MLARANIYLAGLKQIHPDSLNPATSLLAIGSHHPAAKKAAWSISAGVPVDSHDGKRSCELAFHVL
jgi:hypothetical protein